MASTASANSNGSAVTIKGRKLPIRKMIPWRFNGERFITTLYRNPCYYACYVKSMEISKSALRIHIEARGEWDLRSPARSQFWMVSAENINLQTCGRIKGNWIEEKNPALSWSSGIQKGCLEIPRQRLYGASPKRSILYFQFAALGYPGMEDYPATPLVEFPEGAVSDQWDKLMYTDENETSENDDTHEIPWKEVFPKSTRIRFGLDDPGAIQETTTGIFCF